MTKFLKILLSAIVGLAVLVVAIGLFLPSEYEVERDIVIQATPTDVHVYVNDLTKWPEWGPWEEEDPTITTTLGATTSGVGAHQSWSGDSGTGELTFTASNPTTGVAYDLSFDEGAFISVAAIQYTAQGNATKVTWVMQGDVGFNLMGRYFGLAADALVGPMFERGLTKLKARVETSS